MVTSTFPGALYVLLLALAPQPEAPAEADPFVHPADPPVVAGERMAALAPPPGGSLPQKEARERG